MWEQGVRKDEAEIEKLKKVSFFFWGGPLPNLGFFDPKFWGNLG